MLTAPLVIFVGGFIGLSLAPSPSMATLPVAALIVGVALAGMPAALIMQKIGRKSGFVYATLIGLLGSILAIYSIRNGLFWGVCISVLLLGMHLAFVYQFRFAALEWVKPKQAAQATSFMMLGGLVAAWVGPEMAMFGIDFLSVKFTGTFLLLAIAHGLLLIMVNFIEFVDLKKADNTEKGRSWVELLISPGIAAAIVCSAVAYGVMSLIMTATPVSMSEVQNFPLSDTKVVIQSHIMAMFAPSIFAPLLLKYINTAQMLLLGLVAMIVAITIALLDQSYWGYWGALIFIGFGWNFSFVAGTSLLAQSYAPEESFSAQAVNELAVFGTQAVMSLLAGVIVFNYGWNALNLFAIPLLAFALFMLGRWYLKTDRQIS
jgi:predicted MFS family arabinose efflux permease